MKYSFSKNHSCSLVSRLLVAVNQLYPHSFYHSQY